MEMSIVKTVLVVLVLLFSTSAHGKTEEFFYNKTCPNAETIVRDVVTSHLRANRTVPAALLRLFFHDCFVEGCDGSLLLDASDDGAEIEKEGAPNKNSVRGFEVIDDAKKQLESACPGVVSCADIVALAARDSVVLTGLEFFVMPTGRFDGRISRKDNAENALPSPFFNATELKNNFANQNLTVEDLVHLSGGHTIGQSQCRFFERRLFNYSGTGRPDPAINATYLSELQQACPQNGNGTNRVALDKDSEFVVDNNYYKNLRLGKGLLESDNALVVDSETERLVRSFAGDESRFLLRFKRALLKMGELRVKTKANGEIRRNCRSVNPKTISTPVEDEHHDAATTFMF